MSFYEKSIEIDNLYNGKVVTLELHTVELDNGKTAKREIVRHRGGVAIVALTKDNEIFMVRQFRKPYDKELLEVPAGKLEKGEIPEETALRELKEETGLSAERVALITIMYPSPGYTDEKIYIYKAEALTQGEISLDEDEFLNIERHPLIKAVQMVENGEINDAKTIIGILMTADQIKK